MSDLILPDDLPQPRAPEPQAPSSVPNAVPVTLHLLNGKKFIVSNVGAWSYEEVGVFATGQFHGYSGEIDVLVPYDRIDYYELDFERLQNFIAKRQAAAESVEEGEDASPST